MAESTARSLTPAVTAVARTLPPGGGREPSADELRQRVASRFRSLAATTGALRSGVRQRVEASTNLKRQALRHPYWLLGAAAGAGLLAAGMLRRRRGPIGWRVASLVAGVVIKRLASRLESKVTRRVTERRAAGAWRR